MFDLSEELTVIPLSGGCRSSWETVSK